MMFSILPKILLGLLIGPCIDRLNKVKVLILADIARALIVFITKVVKKEELIEANVLSSTTQSFISMLGPAIGGFIILVFGINVSFYFDCFTYILSAFSIYLLTRLE